LNFEICELLLNSCSKLPKTKDDPFFETITNSEQKSSPAEIFKKTFGTLILAKNLKETPSLKQDQITVIDELSLNEWFHKEICKAAVNFLMPPSPEYAEKIFTEALMVRDGKTSYPLEDLPQKTETEKNRNLLALSILGKIGASQNELPPECRGFAIKIIAELDNFRMGKMENFTQNVRAAREGFMKTTAQMKKIRKVLEDYEKNYILPHERYSKYFRELSEIETENRKENQKLNIYLDRIEKEFGKEWK
jgi:hypothetical protein